MHSTHLGPAAGGARFWHYADDADGADGCAAPVARHELQERHGRPAARRRQGGHPRRPDRTKTPEMLARVRQGGGRSRRPLRHRRGRRHERRRHDRDPPPDASSSPACRSRAARSAAIPDRTRRSACSSASRRRSSARSARTASRACTSRCRARAASPRGVALHACAEGASCPSPTSIRPRRRSSLTRPAARLCRRTRSWPRGRCGQPERAWRDPDRADRLQR